MVKRWLLVCVALVGLLTGSSASAHETDQFSMPEDGEFADLGGYFNRIFVKAIHDGVERANKAIDKELARKHPRQSKLDELQQPERIAKAVRQEMPTAMQLIEGLERRLPGEKFKAKYPGKVTIYKKHFEDGMHTGLHGPLDPRVIGRLWRSGTIRIYDSYMGTDKIGHFVDMGYHYYKKYRKGIRKGESIDQAMQRAVDLGTKDWLVSENAILGKASSGAYSNADLASNYVGCLLFRNLTEVVELNGKKCLPTTYIDAQGRFAVAAFVDDDPAFFRRYVCDHYNEALNPSLFEKGMRKKARKVVAQRRANLVAYWYADADGNPREPGWFITRNLELATYHGKDYGHSGQFDQLVNLGNTAPAEELAASE